jgi:hypothetical protein
MAVELRYSSFAVWGPMVAQADRPMVSGGSLRHCLHAYIAYEACLLILAATHPDCDPMVELQDCHGSLMLAARQL